MLSRALSLATVTLLIGCLAAIPVRAQNLEAGKSPSQIFSGTCSACHKGPRGLLKSVPAGSLPGFLRQHYTTSSEMASQLSAFLISNGATDTRVGSRPTQQPKDARPAVPEQLDRFGRPIRPAPQDAARPEAEPQQAAKQDGAGPDGRKSAAKQKLSKRGKPEEPAKADAARDEPGKTESAKEHTPQSETAPESAQETAKEAAKETANETAKEATKETVKDDTAKPHGETQSQSAKVDAPRESGETPALRSDPLPAVTAAPPGMSAAISNGTSEPSAVPAPPPAPAMTASTPPLPPVPPAGPPAPPISQ
jgi:hypothetical protein